MPDYGFAIDLRKCIGCHACTIACKAEHEIPIGVNRCWVKTVETGRFPETRRLFFPVLCNQCEDAPCVRICPTSALYRRRDGIVDLNGDSCIGCRACMEACPYDQLFIDPNTRTAEKCNFCANRVENRLLPACVSVCPTECRIFGDLDDPDSEVARIVRQEQYDVRKPEKATRPKVFYLGAEDSVIRPEASIRPFLYKEGQVHLRPVGAPGPGPDVDPGAPRVDYDVPHAQPWGVDMVLYLIFKAIATGAMGLAAVMWWNGFGGWLTTLVAPAVSLLFISLTAVVLIVDLDRPERFYYILTRSNWRSWMVWGAYFLTAHGLLSAAWLAGGWFGWAPGLDALAVPVALTSILATCYTGFLFAQGRGRDLWQGPYPSIDLIAQSAAAGSAALLIAAHLMVTMDEQAAAALSWLRWVLAAALVAHVVTLIVEHLLRPSPTRHHELAVHTILRGTYAPLFWGGAIALGGFVPLLLLLPAGSGGARLPIAALLALGGSAAWEYIWVEAGQSVPLS
jgi:Fe-S-cluster-containing dehydrogenase component/formate-dependent nitrite reductase membrane component NrfD